MIQFGRKTLCTCFASIVFVHGAATAQQRETEALEEILVTAQKRVQSLQDAAVTVSVYGGAGLEQAQISGLQAFSDLAPSLSMDAFPQSQPRPVMRGIGNTDRGAGSDQSTAIFVDGVYQSRPAFVSFDSFDLERIEVTKGPQGTLWGKNVVGGAINIITNKPQSDFDARVSLTAGNIGTFNASAMLNAPIGGSGGAIRAVVNSLNRDGFARNIFLNKDQDDQSRFSGRVHISLIPSETSDLLLTFYGSSDDNAGPARHQYSSTITDLSLDPDGSPRLTTANTNGFDKKDIWGANATLNWDLGFANFTGQAAYRSLDYHKLEDIDGNNLADQLSGGIVGIQQLDLREEEKTDVWSIETRLSASEGAAIFWQVGAFYERDDIDRRQFSKLFLPLAGRNVEETIITPNKTDSFAVFGEVTYALSDRANITGGLRWTKDEKTFGATAAQLGPGRVFVTNTYTGLETTESWDKVTWRVTGDIRFTDQVFGFATVSTGFKSGGFQDTPPNPVAAVTPFDPENIINYEVGLKSDWSRGRANISAFFMDLTDQQVRNRDQDGALITENAGKSEVKGVEVELQYAPVDSLTLSLQYAFIDGTLTKFIDQGVDRSGNRLQRTPRNAYTAGAKLRLGDLLNTAAQIDLNVDYAWKSSRFDDNSNLPPAIVKAHGLLGARVVLAPPSERWDLVLWGSNLTDETYAAHYPVFGFGSWILFAPPRTYGVTFNWRHH